MKTHWSRVRPVWLLTSDSSVCKASNSRELRGTVPTVTNFSRVNESASSQSFELKFMHFSFKTEFSNLKFGDSGAGFKIGPSIIFPILLCKITDCRFNHVNILILQILLHNMKLAQPLFIGNINQYFPMINCKTILLMVTLYWYWPAIGLQWQVFAN